MILHAVYVVISGLTVTLLVKLKASPPLFLTTFIFSVYNLAIVGEFVLYGSVGFHDYFKAIASSQMIIELLIMLSMGIGGLYVCGGLCSKSNYIRSVNRLFRSRIRLCNWRLA